MANQEHLDILKQGVDTWNQWRKEHRAVLPDLGKADLIEAHLEGSILDKAHLEGALLKKAHLQGASLIEAHLERADLSRAHLEGAYLEGAYLEGAKCYEAYLERSTLYGAHLEGAILTRSTLVAADLTTAHLEGAYLGGANLTHITLDNKTSLHEVVFGDHKHGTAQLVDISWGDANLTAIDWTDVKALGDEQKAHQSTTKDGRRKDKSERLKEFQYALRANRQVAVVLRDQGLSEKADRFAYRAQRLKRIILRRRVFLPGTSLWRKIRSLSGYIFSLLHDLLAGYGYRPERTVITYLLMIIGFAAAYHFFGGLSLDPPDAFVYSLTSFHGRGFFPGLQNNHSLHDPLVMLAALEAVIGLVIEASFIATFTQRYFGR